MTSSANIILDQALELGALDRANVADLLVEAYKKGGIKTTSAEKVFAKYRKT